MSTTLTGLMFRRAEQTLHVYLSCGLSSAVKMHSATFRSHPSLLQVYLFSLYCIYIVVAALGCYCCITPYLRSVLYLRFKVILLYLIIARGERVSNGFNKFKDFKSISLFQHV